MALAIFQFIRGIQKTITAEAFSHIKRPIAVAIVIFSFRTFSIDALTATNAWLSVRSVRNAAILDPSLLFGLVININLMPISYYNITYNLSNSLFSTRI